LYVMTLLKESRHEKILYSRRSVYLRNTNGGCTSNGTG
jgi:hypothetical protein